MAVLAEEDAKVILVSVVTEFQFHVMALLAWSGELVPVAAVMLDSGVEPAVQLMAPALVIVQLLLIATLWNFVPSATNNLPAVIVAEPTSVSPVKLPAEALVILPSASTVIAADPYVPAVTVVEDSWEALTEFAAKLNTPALVTVAAPLKATL